jgi:hypothetical protein
MFFWLALFLGAAFVWAWNGVSRIPIVIMLGIEAVWAVALLNENVGIAHGLSGPQDSAGWIIAAPFIGALAMLLARSLNTVLTKRFLA